MSRHGPADVVSTGCRALVAERSERNDWARTYSKIAAHLIIE